MLQIFDREDRPVPMNLLSDLLSKVSDIGKRIGVDTDKRMSELSVLNLCDELLRRERSDRFSSSKLYIGALSKSERR